MSCCPTCGQKAAQLPIEAIADVALPNVLRTVTNALIKAYPDAVPTDDLIAAIYSGSKRPATATKALRVQIHRLRAKLMLCGWTVNKNLGGFYGAHYRLEQLV
ncbi:MAG: helix-turn-helix domain-containing protein [Mesorhizobium sp.]|nr:MAG: helix-turn-helix domain-containing protein [Mesorhizobium sp.]